MTFTTRLLTMTGFAIVLLAPFQSGASAQGNAGAQARSASPAPARARLPFEGVWDEIRLRDGNASASQKPNHMRRMFIDGYYSLTNASEGRHRNDKPVGEMTREELLDRFRSLQVQDGTYEVTGTNTIRLKRRISQFPENHGTEQVMEWNVDSSGVLSLKIISETGSAPLGSVTTYQRLK